MASTFTLAFVLVALALMVQAPATPELGVFIDFLFPRLLPKQPNRWCQPPCRLQKRPSPHPLAAV
ncbi:MAG: hypothetical protein R2857_08745 [Vampirovibrionales bacterium]